MLICFRVCHFFLFYFAQEKAPKAHINRRKKTAQTNRLYEGENMDFIPCMWKSLKCAQNLHYFARSHDRETMSFRNSAVTSFTFLLTLGTGRVCYK